MTSYPSCYLVDGASYIYRAFHAIRQLTTSHGEPTNAIFGFAQMLQRILRQEQPVALAVAFDPPGPTFRHELFPQYKAQRPPMPEELAQQLPWIRNLLAAMRIPVIEQASYEADDVIATLARRWAAKGYQVTIVSADKDLYQLVSPRIQLLDTMKDKRVDEGEVCRRFGAVEHVVDIQALAGDSADNIPGVPGIGEKTALQLVQQYGSVEKLLQQLSQVSGLKRRQALEEHADVLPLYKQLVTLKDDLPLADDELARQEPDWDALQQLYRQLEFYQLLQEMAPQSSAADPEKAYDYRAVTQEQDLTALVAELQELPLLALDTETSSLVATQAQLVGISLAWQEDAGVYIPVGHSGAQEQIPLPRVLELLRPLLEAASPCKLGQNIKYDALVLSNYGIRLGGHLEDTMVLSYVLHPEHKSHALDAMAQVYLQRRLTSYAEVAGKGKSQVPFAQVPVATATPYAAEDAEATWQLYQHLAPQLHDSPRRFLYEEVERPLLQVLVAMERQGINVDAQRLAGISRELGAAMEEKSAHIYTLAGQEFNINSPKQLGDVLFEHLQLPRGRRTKTGWSTDVDVLQKLAADHPIAAEVLAYRSLAKLKNTYADSLIKLIHPQTGRLHTQFNQTVTATGRLSSSEPNLQNIPIRTEEGRKIREAFVPTAGNRLLAADYSQIELRVLAHLAGEQRLQEAFAQGEDIHARTAREVLDAGQEVDPQLRRRAKTINFGLVYGMGAQSLARDLGISRSEAKAYIDTYFERYPGIRDYMEQRKEEARQWYGVVTLMGRFCAIPEIDSKNHMLRSYAERNAINYPVQGSAADIIKVAMVRIHNRLHQEGWQSSMVLQVHDELLFDVPEGEIEGLTALVRREMQQAVDMAIPLEVEIGVGQNWRQAH